MLFSKIFGRAREEKPVERGLSQSVTFGKNYGGEAAEVILNIPEKNYRRVIVGHDGCFRNFPGIERGDWTYCVKKSFDFNKGRVEYRTSFESRGDGYRCLWTIQPDGRYWADEDGFGAEDDSEVILYADLDARGKFKGPFRIYSIGGIRQEESGKEPDGEKKRQAGRPLTTRQLVQMALESLPKMMDKHVPDSGPFQPVSVSFPVSHSGCMAKVSVEKSAADENMRRLRICVYLDGTDRLYNHFYSQRTNDELKAYLQSEEALTDILRSIEELAKSAKG